VTVATDAADGWQVLLVGERAAEVDGGEISDDEHGLLVRGADGAVQVTLAPRTVSP
jgi:hypothetical protein